MLPAFRSDHDNVWVLLRHLIHHLTFRGEAQAPHQPPASSSCREAHRVDDHLCITKDAGVPERLSANQFRAGQLAAMVSPQAIGNHDPPRHG